MPLDPPSATSLGLGTSSPNGALAAAAWPLPTGGCRPSHLSVRGSPQAVLPPSRPRAEPGDGKVMVILELEDGQGCPESRSVHLEGAAHWAKGGPLALKPWGLGLGQVPGPPSIPPGHPGARDPLSRQSLCWGCPEARASARGSPGLTGQADPGLPEPWSLPTRGGAEMFLPPQGSRPHPPALTLFLPSWRLQDPQAGCPLAPSSSACARDRPGEARCGPGVTEALELVGARGLALSAPGRMMPPTGAPGSVPERPGQRLPWWGAMSPSAQLAPFWVLVPDGVGGAPAETASSCEGLR